MPDDTTRTDPRPGSVSFWERLCTLGVRGALTLGTVTAWIAMIFLGIAVPREFVWFVYGVSGWLISAELLKALRG